MWTEAMWFEDGVIWFLGMNDGCIYCWEIDNGKVTYIDSVVDYGVNPFRRYSGIIKQDYKLFLLPDLENTLLVYHLDTKEIYRYVLPRKGSRFLARGGFIENSCFFFVSSAERAVFEINMNNFSEVTSYSVVIDDEQEIGEEFERKGDKLYIPCKNQNVILVFDIVTKEIKKYQIGDLKGGFCTICYTEGVFWLTGTCGKMIKWDEGSNEIRDVLNIPEGVEQYWLDRDREQLIKEKYPCSVVDGVAPFYKSYSGKKYIWFIPFYAEQIVYVDKDTNERRILVLDGEYEDYDSQTMETRLLFHKYIMEYADGDKMILFSCKTRNMYELDCNQASYRELAFDIEWDFLISQWIEHLDILSEDEYISLQGFLSAITLSKENRNT